eukprot:216741_1
MRTLTDLEKTFWPLPSRFRDSEDTYNYAALTKYCAKYHIRTCKTEKCVICIDWNIFFRNKSNSYSKLLQDDPHNIAFASMLGFQLYNAEKYQQCLSILKRIKWRYPLIPFIIAWCYFCLNDFASAVDFLNIVNNDNDWSFVTDCTALKASNTDLNSLGIYILGNVYRSWLNYKHINKWTNDQLQGLYNCYIHNLPAVMEGSYPPETIHVCYWLNNYKKGLELICMINETNMRYLKCAEAVSTTSTLILLNMGRLEKWKEIIKYFGCHIWFSLFMGIDMPDSEYDHCSHSLSLIESLKSKPGKCWTDILCLYGNVKNTYMNFAYNAKICLYRKIEPGELRLNPQWFIFYYCFAKFMYFKVKECKIAYLLYRIALKYNKYDPRCYLDLALLMKDCGKLQKALIYLEKAKELNEMVYNANNCLLILDEIVGLQALENQNSMNVNWLNMCNWCSKKMKSILKCKKCKAVNYCSRKHQKLDWKYTHKKQCKYYSKTRTKRRLFTFLNSRSFSIISDRL